MSSESESESYHAVVEMGSNGIRCMISDLKERTSRLLPSLYQTRIPISLYDAQFPRGTDQRQPLPPETIETVVSSLRRFKQTCEDFDVNNKNVTVVATEATRAAVNGDELLKAIKHKLDWDVKILTKEEEAIAGALGTAVTLPDVEGLFMDLGGGSLQIAWLDTTNPDWARDLNASTYRSFSLPYGAAALLERIEATQGKKEKQDRLRVEIVEALQQALVDLNVEHRCRDGPINLFLTGGGFRGWGYCLMALRSAYPFSWINGFAVTPAEFYAHQRVMNLVYPAGSHEGSPTSNILSDSDDNSVSNVFRLSKRRKRQIIATQFLIPVIAQTFPLLNEVVFAQGGTLQGILVQKLPSLQASMRFRTSPFDIAIGTMFTSYSITNPPFYFTVMNHLDGTLNELFPRDMVSLFYSLTEALYLHATLPKDVQAYAALQFAITGPLAGIIGVTHRFRACFSLVLAERWGGRSALPPDGHRLWDQMIKIAGPDASWNCRFLGRMGALLGLVWPAGTKGGEARNRLRFSGKAEGNKIYLTVTEGAHDVFTPEALKAVKKIEKMGKRKHWVDLAGQEPQGRRVEVRVERYK